MKQFWLWGIRYTATNYDEAVSEIIKKAKQGSGYGVSALAVHGLIEGYKNENLAKLINQIDLVVPDGQPIKWALNTFFDAKLKDRVYGPTLMLEVLKRAEIENIGIFLFGSKEETLFKLKENLLEKYPNLKIVGAQPDRFRDATEKEKVSDIDKINASGAKIVFVGRGCPRQEIWVAENKPHINAVLIAVGAAFDFHAGIIPQAPAWMQRNGLEWLFRLTKEPKRLWKRYFVTNSIYLYLFIINLLKKTFKM